MQIVRIMYQKSKFRRKFHFQQVNFWKNKLKKQAKAALKSKFIFKSIQIKTKLSILTFLRPEKTKED